jgi:hypothetical protein
MGGVTFGWTLPNGPALMERRPDFVADVQRGLERISGHFRGGVDHFELACPDPHDLTTLDLLCSEVLPAVNTEGTNP